MYFICQTFLYIYSRVIVFYYMDIDTSAYLYNAILRFIPSSLQLSGYVLAKAQRSRILLFFVKQSFTLVILLLRRRNIKKIKKLYNSFSGLVINLS